MSYNSFWLLTTMLLLTAAYPALAQYTQDVTAPNGGGQGGSRAQTRPQMQLKDIGRPYFLRVTTGAHTTAGWEKSLTNKDQNLRHWTWMPVTSFDQTVVGVGEPRPRLPQRPEHVYKKPNANQNSTAMAQRPDGDAPLEPLSPGRPIYVRPYHIPLPTVDHGPLNLPPPRRITTADLSGRVKLPRPSTPHRQAALPTKTYAPYSAVSALSGLLRPGTSESSAQKTVRGKLLSH